MMQPRVSWSRKLVKGIGIVVAAWAVFSVSLVLQIFPWTPTTSREWAVLLSVGTLLFAAGSALVEWVPDARRSGKIPTATVVLLWVMYGILVFACVRFWPGTL